MRTDAEGALSPAKVLWDSLGRWKQSSHREEGSSITKETVLQFKGQRQPLFNLTMECLPLHHQFSKSLFFPNSALT